jgi:hypothetical protein
MPLVRTKMLIADAEHDQKICDNVEGMQRVAQVCQCKEVSFASKLGLFCKPQVCQ